MCVKERQDKYQASNRKEELIGRYSIFLREGLPLYNNPITEELHSYRSHDANSQ